MNRPRYEHESYEDYKRSLRGEEKSLKYYLRGTYAYQHKNVPMEPARSLVGHYVTTTRYNEIINAATN